PAVELDVEKTEPLPPVPGILAEFASTVDEMMKSLEAVAAIRRKSRFPGGNGGRVLEADLLLWEGAFYLHRARHFCLHVWQLLLEEKEILSRKGEAARQERYECY